MPVEAPERMPPPRLPRLKPPPPPPPPRLNPPPPPRPPPPPPARVRIPGQSRWLRTRKSAANARYVAFLIFIVFSCSVLSPARSRPRFGKCPQCVRVDGQPAGSGTVT
jgi:hypothetical protein